MCVFFYFNLGILVVENWYNMVLIDWGGTTDSKASTIASFTTSSPFFLEQIYFVKGNPSMGNWNWVITLVLVWCVHLALETKRMSHIDLVCLFFSSFFYISLWQISYLLFSGFFTISHTPIYISTKKAGKVHLHLLLHPT